MTNIDLHLILILAKNLGNGAMFSSVGKTVLTSKEKETCFDQIAIYIVT
ncbi:MAG: hypothetical protein ACR5KW_01175 [Wolbachia sp.]